MDFRLREEPRTQVLFTSLLVQPQHQLLPSLSPCGLSCQHPSRGEESQRQRDTQTNRVRHSEWIWLLISPKEGRTTSQRPSANHSLCPINRIRSCALKNQSVAGWMGLSSNASGSPCELKLILQTEVVLCLMGGVEWTVGRPPLYPLL